MKEEVEVVISGVSGAFPECQGIPEFEEALFNKANLVTNDKWKQDYDFPTYCGKAHSCEVFDALFFNVPFSMPKTMDVITRRCLEASVEAIIDAGVSPKSLKGTRTAVYSCYDFSESECCVSYTQKVNVLLGTVRTFTANRVSFALNLNGPSFVSEGGRGFLFHLFRRVKSELQEGKIEAAIVSVGNVLMTPRSLAILDGMGLAASDGNCCPFDEQAHGYPLSEGCVAFYLQRASDAKRVYATVIGSDHRFLGTKSGNILTFDERPAKQMLRELYSEWNADPTQVAFVEADGCGVKDLDLKEVDIIADVFCRNRKNPLLIGSVKSNVGHADSAACAISTVKALIALSRSKIPPNININSPLPQLATRGIKVVSETTPLNGEFVAVNAVGLAGQFGHLLLKKGQRGGPATTRSATLPQLLLLSSRTEIGIEQILQHTQTMDISPEFGDLLNGVFRLEVKNHLYRGYRFVSLDGSKDSQKTKRVDGGKRPIWWVFSGMGSQWNQMGSQLMHFSIFRDAIDRCERVLKPHGVDIKHIITTDDNSIFDNILNSFVGITAIQLGLVEILRALEIEPDGLLGHSLGELGCAYADNCMTLEQTILASFARGKASLEAKLVKGMMAAIGMSHSEIISQLPETIDVACHNSDSSCTISGPTADVDKFVIELKSKGVFAKSVNVGNIAYHSRYIQPAAPILMKYLKEVLPEKTKRSKKWITTSVPKENWNSELAAYSSPEYHTNNLLSPVLLEEVLKYVPSNAVVIEIAPHGLLQAILKRAFRSSVTNVTLTNRASSDGVEFLLDAIGEMYLLGYEPNVSALYPPVQYPVPSETPSLRPFVTWDHSETYGVPEMYDATKLSVCERVISLKEIQDTLDTYASQGSPISPLAYFLRRPRLLLSYFCILMTLRLYGGERCCFIARCRKFCAPSLMDHQTRYVSPMLQSLALAEVDDYFRAKIKITTSRTVVEIWKIVGSTEKRPFHETPIFFKEIHVYSEIDLLTEDLSHVYLSVLRGSGDFIVNQVMKTDGNAVESDKTLLRGRCKVSEEPSSAPSLKTIVEDFQSEKETDPVFSDVDSDNPVASKLSEIQVCSKGAFGKIEWTQDWAINLNTIIDLHLHLNTDKAGRLIEVASIQSVHLIPESLQSKTDGSKIEFYIDSSTARFDCEGVIVDGLSTRPARSKDCNLAIILDFVPYGETSFSTEYEFIKACLEVILENSSQENTADKKITIFKRRNDLMANQVCSWLKDAVNSFNSKKQELFQVKVEESYFADEIESSDLLVSMVLADDKNGAYSMIIQPYQSRRVSEKEHSVVYEQNFGTDRFLFLKKVNGVSKLRTFKLDKDWRLSIEKLKTNSAQPGETVLLVIDDPSLANPLFSAREVSRELIAYKTRCYIILDGKAPSFSPHSQIYGSQIQRDVAVNVLVNGRWGRYRRQEIPRAVLTRMSHTTVETVDGDEEVDIKYLSFNETNHGGNEDGVTLLDYSGVTRSGHRVMGLARKKDGVGEKAVPDPILRWKLSPQIPLDVAATLPYAYLMGNLAIRDLQTFHEYKKQVMVHNGQTPVGTACISLALTNGHTVYCTVPNGAAKELIMENFPQIPASRITNHMDRDFFVPLMLETKGHGADLIISDLPEEQMHNSWNCIATHGVFVNLNGALAAHNSPLPMSNFLKMTSFLSYTPREIANFSPERKRRLSGLVEEWLLAEHPVKIPHRIFAPDEINGSVKASCLQPEEKLLLNLQDCKRNIVKGIIENGRASEIDDILPHTNPEIYFILCSTLEDSMTLMKSLAQRNIKQFAIASLDSPPHEDALKALQICAKEHDVSVSVMSGVNSLSRKDAEALMRRVSKIGVIKAAFVVSSENNIKFVKDIIEIVISASPAVPIINIHDRQCPMVQNVISVIRDGNVDPTEVLDHALLNTNRQAVYFVSKKSIKNDQNTSGGHEANQIKDLLPSSVEELEEIGLLLTSRDSECDTSTRAKFIPTASLAPPMIALHQDIRPLFIIPAFCETQMRSLISRLMYPCFVAHIHSDAKSIDQVASNLLESMLRIQKNGPYSIVAETWSGGLAMALSRLLAEAGHDATLFLLQGVPDKLKHLLPPQESVSKLLINALFAKFKVGDTIQNAINQLSRGHDKSHIERAVNSVLQNLEFLRSYDSEVKLQHSLVLFELGRQSRLTANDINRISDKAAQLIKSDRKIHKEMLTDPVVLSTINAEAPFSWDSY